MASRYRRLKRVAGILLILLLLAGSYITVHWRRTHDPYSILKNAHALTLYRIIGGDIVFVPSVGASTDRENFHDCTVLRKREINDARTAEAIVSTVLVATVKGKSDMAAMCFRPRHAVRINTWLGPLDFVICFECSQMLVYSGYNPMPVWFPIDGNTGSAALDEAYPPPWSIIK